MQSDSVLHTGEVEFNPKFTYRTSSTTNVVRAFVNSEKWQFRVHLFKDQYLVTQIRYGCAIGVGFLLDFDLNLPYDSEDLIDHILPCKHYDEITKELVTEGVEKLRIKIQDYLAQNFQTKSFGCNPKYCSICPRPECEHVCITYHQHRWLFPSIKSNLPTKCNVCHINRNDKQYEEKFLFD